jgi:protein subunit release factor B
MLRRLLFLEKDLIEKFVRGGGPGGQKINKSMSRVQLLHVPTGIRIETQRFRDLYSNRQEARKLLNLKLDLLFNKENSKLSKQIDVLKKQKQNKRRKALKKYKP